MSIKRLTDEQLRQAAEELGVEFSRVKQLYERAIANGSPFGLKELVSLKETEPQPLREQSAAGKLWQGLQRYALKSAEQTAPGIQNLSLPTAEGLLKVLQRQFDERNEPTIAALEQHVSQLRQQMSLKDASNPRQSMYDAFTSRTLNPQRQDGITLKDLESLPDEEIFRMAFASKELNQPSPVKLNTVDRGAYDLFTSVRLNPAK